MTIKIINKRYRAFFFFPSLYCLDLDKVVQPEQMAVSRHNPTTPISPCNAAEDHKVFSATRITGVQEMRSAQLQFL